MLLCNTKGVVAAFVSLLLDVWELIIFYSCLGSLALTFVHLRALLLFPLIAYIFFTFFYINRES